MNYIEEQWVDMTVDLIKTKRHRGEDDRDIEDELTLKHAFPSEIVHEAFNRLDKHKQSNFQKMIDRVAGTWSLPTTGNAVKLVKLIKRLQAGMWPDESHNGVVESSAYGLLGDDQLFDELNEIARGYLKSCADAMVNRLKQLAKNNPSSYRDPDDHAAVLRVLSKVASDDTDVDFIGEIERGERVLTDSGEKRCASNVTKQFYLSKSYPNIQINIERSVKFDGDVDEFIKELETELTNIKHDQKEAIKVLGVYIKERVHLTLNNNVAILGVYLDVDVEPDRYTERNPVDELEELGYEYSSNPVL